MAKTIQAKLRKVMSNKTVKGVELVAVNASYNPMEAHSAIRTIATTDEFVDSIPAEGACYNIEDCGDSYKIDEIQEVPACPDQYIMMLRSAYSLKNTLDYIRWNACGADLDDVRCSAGNFHWQIDEQINTIAEWAVVELGSIPHPDTWMCVDGQPACASFGFMLGVNLETIFRSLECYIASLEIFYCNMSHEKKAVIDRWLQDWKHEAEYRLQRKLMPDTMCVPCNPTF